MRHFVRCVLILFATLVLDWQLAVAAPQSQRSNDPSDDPFASLRASLLKAAETNPETFATSVPIPESLRATGPAQESRSASRLDFERAFARRYWGGREGELHSALERLGELQTTIEPVLRQEGVPAELLAVVLVESAARPYALSPKGARGLWQFIPATAVRYGMTVSPRQDDRLDAIASTRAAARYLRDLYARFGDWKLALAAYNAGEQTIQQAIIRAGSADFENLNSRGLLPQETSLYVRAVLDAMSFVGGRASSIPAIREAASRRPEAVVFAVVTVGGNASDVGKDDRTRYSFAGGDSSWIRQSP